MRPNPPVRIIIDRDLTNEHRGLVATFAEPMTVFRVMDGEELAIIFAAGKIEGGMFATRSERRYGASWATSSMEDVAKWGRYWSRNKRLGEDLFVAVADAKDRVFYHEVAHRSVPFDPAGEVEQIAELDSNVCNTGLGCSMTVSVKDVSFFSVGPSDELEPMTEGQIKTYLRKHPLPDVLLRPLGGTNWFGGVILGRSVSVGQDPHDKLWMARNRADKPFVLGGKTKKAVVDEAIQIIVAGAENKITARLNRVPYGFDDVKIGQRWTESNNSRGYGGGREVVIDHIGASYVEGYGKASWNDDKVHLVVTATELMKKWREKAT